MDGPVRNKINLVNFFPYIITILSIILIYQNIDYINNDGVRYLAQSELISKGKYLEAFQLHKMIFYPYLIYLINYLCGLSFFVSAKLLNIFSIFIVSYFFMKIYQSIFQKNENSDFFILLISLFSFISFFDDYINFIIRDLISVGFLFGFVFFIIRYIKRNDVINLFYSFIFIILAALLRIESIVFLIFPFLFYIKRFSLNGKFFLIMLFFFVISISFLQINSDIFKDIIFKKNNFSNIFISRLWLNELDNHLVHNFDFLINNNILNFISKLIFSLYCMLTVLFKINIINFSLFFYFRKYFFNIFHSNKVLNFLFYVFLVSLMLILLNFMLTDVLSKRYFIFSYFIFSIFVAFVLKHLWINTNLKLIFYIYLFVLSAIIFIDKKKYNYEKELAEFITFNKFAYDMIYVSDAKTRFYLNAFIDQDFTINQNRYYEAIFIPKISTYHQIDLTKYQQVYFNNELDQKFIFYKAKNDY